MRRGIDRADLVGTWCPGRVNPPHWARSPFFGEKEHFLGNSPLSILFTSTDIAMKANIKLEQLVSCTDIDAESLGGLNGNK